MLHTVVMTLLVAISICAGSQHEELLSDAAMKRMPVGDGVALHYMEQGSGPAVILIHGSLADYSYWQLSEQIVPLAERHRVIVYSRRYNYPNQNPLAANHSPFVEARDLAAFIDALGLLKVHLVGHSYGAYTALAYALEYPGKLHKLVLAEPPIISWLPEIQGGEGIEDRFMANVWQPLAVAFEQNGKQGGLDFTANWYFQSAWQDVPPEWQLLFSRNADEWQVLAQSADTFPELDREKVRGLRIPTLLLSGGKNAGKFNDLIDGELERLLPDARRVVIPNASHEMFLDAPLESTQAISRFLEER